VERLVAALDPILSRSRLIECAWLLTPTRATAALCVNFILFLLGFPRQTANSRINSIMYNSITTVLAGPSNEL
jgi:hypothetical protein